MSRHPLDPLKRHYDLITVGDNTTDTRLKCKHCPTSYKWSGDGRDGRKKMKKHLQDSHPGTYREDYVMTTEDSNLQADVSGIIYK